MNRNAESDREGELRDDKISHAAPRRGRTIPPDNHHFEEMLSCTTSDYRPFQAFERRFEPHVNNLSTHGLVESIFAVWPISDKLRRN